MVRRDMFGLHLKDANIPGLPPLPRTELDVDIESYIAYPTLTPLPVLLKRWPPDDVRVPDIPGIKEGSLQRFDYLIPEQRYRARLLTTHEVPFILYNVPEIDAVANKWTDDYLATKFGSQIQSVLKSQTNHFPYWNKRSARKEGPGYRPPTEPISVTFEEYAILHATRALVRARCLQSPWHPSLLLSNARLADALHGVKRFMKMRDVADTAPVESEHIYLQINSDNRCVSDRVINTFTWLVTSLMAAVAEMCSIFEWL